ncbi:hypothetical protein [Parvibaculum sp.]|jgi:flagellar motility protein MotE (MotC chaperone)|uniref:MotE family protein n=2 Tax=Parvibaculum sp. TaxID=2024848 RepID=UPI001B16A236|nr:hypothetical protein [Parvibaculum sp.]MBO6679899.1 flagellar protein FlbB [Parvibaculum sp.]MBO6903635.1 flagellar protein FlbB [Parvibaculum sp.]
MFNRLRLLPTVMLCAALLLALKLADIASGGAAISPAQASASKAIEEEAPEAETDHDKTAADSESGGRTEGDAVVSVEPAMSEEEAAAPISKSEMTVLESLSERRKELATRAEALDTRERLLAAAEKRVEDRIAELKEIEARINARIGEQDAENEARLAGLVAMYETMKPKDAARIFERLDMGVLLDVVKRMQPRKMAAVMAAMDPVTAQDLTVELALGEQFDTETVPAAETPETAPAATLRSSEKAS